MTDEELARLEDAAGDARLGALFKEASRAPIADAGFVDAVRARVRRDAYAKTSRWIWGFVGFAAFGAGGALPHLASNWTSIWAVLAPQLGQYTAAMDLAPGAAILALGLATAVGGWLYAERG